MKYRIRLARPDETLPALELAKRVFEEFTPPGYVPDPSGSFAERITSSENIEKYSSGKNLMFIAEDNGKIIGMVNERDGCHISKLFVDRKYHRQGVATRLMERIVCELKLRGVNRITLNSSQYALPFYEKFGFHKTENEQNKHGMNVTPMAYEPKEIWDLLDADGNKTGEYVERGRNPPDGCYFLVVHVWKYNSRGEWLIDKRSARGMDIDGKWETTGGAAIAGDDSKTAALREAREELGIDLDPENGILFRRLTHKWKEGHGCFTDVWVFKTDLPVEAVHLQKEEACDAMWTTAGKIREMMDSGEFIPKRLYPYFDEMTEKFTGQIRNTDN